MTGTGSSLTAVPYEHQNGERDVLVSVAVTGGDVPQEVRLRTTPNQEPDLAQQPRPWPITTAPPPVTGTDPTSCVTITSSLDSCNLTGCPDVS